MHPPDITSTVSFPQVAATGREQSPAPSRPVKPKATTFIVLDNGHLLPTMKKRSSFSASFRTGYEGMQSARWPGQTVNSGDPSAGAATMGYKGIETSYLPRSTVFTKNNPDGPGFNYR